MGIWDILSGAGRGLASLAPIAGQAIGTRFGGPLGGAAGGTLGGMFSNYFNQPQSSAAQQQRPAAQPQQGQQQAPGLQNLSYNNLPQMGAYGGQQLAQQYTHPWVAPYAAPYASRMGQSMGTGMQNMLSPYVPESMRNVSLGDLGYRPQTGSPFSSSLSSMMGQLRGNLPAAQASYPGFGGGYAHGGEVHHEATGGYWNPPNQFKSHMMANTGHPMNLRALSEMGPY